MLKVGDIVILGDPPPDHKACWLWPQNDEALFEVLSLSDDGIAQLGHPADMPVSERGELFRYTEGAYLSAPTESLIVVG